VHLTALLVDVELLLVEVVDQAGGQEDLRAVRLQYRVVLGRGPRDGQP
jgi:hypothetical protein